MIESSITGLVVLNSIAPTMPQVALDGRCPPPPPKACNNLYGCLSHSLPAWWFMFFFFPGTYRQPTLLHKLSRFPLTLKKRFPKRDAWIETSTTKSPEVFTHAGSMLQRRQATDHICHRSRTVHMLKKVSNVECCFTWWMIESLKIPCELVDYLSLQGSAYLLRRYLDPPSLHK